MACKLVLLQTEVVNSWANNNCITVCPACKWLIKNKFLGLSLQVFLPFWRRPIYHYQTNDDNTHSTEWAVTHPNTGKFSHSTDVSTTLCYEMAWHQNSNRISNQQALGEGEKKEN